MAEHINVKLKKLNTISKQNNSQIGHGEENVKALVKEIFEAFGHEGHIHLTPQGYNGPDIILRELPSDSSVIIEVKKFKTSLDDHVEQLRRYCSDTRPLLGIITNGDDFRIYSYFWRGKPFVDSLLLSFNRKQLGDVEFTENLKMLIGRNALLSSIAKSKVEEIEQKHEQMLTVQRERIAELREQKKEIEREINQHQEKLGVFKNKLEHIDNELSNIGITLPGGTKGDKHQVDLESPFALGFSNGIINIKALKEGTHIMFCQRETPTQPYFFLVEGTSDPKEYTPSENGYKLQRKPNEHNFTKHIAEVKSFTVSGRKRELWDNLYKSGEFDLWEIDEGPMKYFEKKRGGEFIWILRVYELPFLLKIGEDFKQRILSDYIIVNTSTLARIKQAWEGNQCRALIAEEEFRRKRQRIMDIIEQYK